MPCPMINPLQAANTSVMILAAGHGKRMLPLTASTPKPLLKVGGMSLIEHHLQRLSDMGFRHVVINIAYLGQMIVDALGDGGRYQLEIDYSDETRSGALETAGGICQALPLLRSDSFLVINADIFTDFPFPALLDPPLLDAARVVIVPNPEHNPSGDFGISPEGKLQTQQADQNYTFSGIAHYQKSFFRTHADNRLGQSPLPLAPLLADGAVAQKIEARLYQGVWHDIGTPARLNALNAQLSAKN